ncbi:cell division cycle protein 27 homolog B-like [Zingiber officinale]|uniref:cell division cycle protein 27 homolog B-like n=1 Tax=Zingiber officinale TaxID=94328 RepID=UPI001C4B40CE|nr:cell division cycle protein 27 homolog B-like [Zingiber officinale]
METLMVDRVQNSLRFFMHRNAIFLCERLCAEFPTEINLQLLATCYLQNGKAYCAYQILKGTSMPHSRYLFAMSCFQMNLLQEAEAALCPANEPNVEVPDGAAGHYLLGLIYRYMGRQALAIEHLMQALTLDPLLWAAYDELCVLGAIEEANDYFSDMAAQRIQQQYLSESSSLNSSNGSEFYNLSSNMAVTSVDSIPRQSKQLGNNTREIASLPLSVMIAKVPASNSGSSNFSQYITPPAATQLSGVAPPPLCRNMHVSFNVANNDVSTKLNNIAVQAPRRKVLDEGKLRKVSGRLFSDSVPRRSTRLSAEAIAVASSNRLSAEAIAVASSNATQVIGNGNGHTSTKFLGGFSSSSSSKVNAASSRSLTFRKGHSWISENFDEGRRSEAFDDSRMENMATTSSSTSMSGDSRYLEQGKAIGDLAQDSRLINGAQELLCLLRTLGEGYRLSCSYRCQEALDAYLKLSEKQFNTGWVLSQVGKIHFELVNYFEADHFFDLARRVSPSILESMDIYSTVLYHMKEEMKLSYLAKELLSVDRLSPQAWCALGNCYSLQKDHETALKNFQRAVQLDSRFVYAHTLCGHEYVELEDFENGIKCYQSALQIDQRHYNSWYGLGVVYLRQEKFKFAEHHLHKAYNINPRSSVLMCYLGMTQHALQRNEDALEMIERAISADKQNPLPVYQKAIILVSLECYDEALNELEQLKESAPHESCVYALMGKIYKRFEMHEKAMLCFGLALDLKPPAADVATIKAAMEKLYLPDEMDDTL